VNLSLITDPFFYAVAVPAVLLLGVWPKPLTDLMEAPIAALVQQLLLGKA